MDQKAICIEGLTIGYGEKVILQDIDFCVESGEIVTILGGSGCGKSTLLKAMIGLLPAMQGRILIDGMDISGGDSAENLAQVRQETGVLFQSSALMGSLTVAENVAMPLREFSELPEILIDEIVRLKLEMVKLGPYGDYLPSELSGGMRKRAGLARAMANDPSILFCDEPSAGLDPVTSAEMDELILELNNTLKVTMLVVTHELSSIYAISNRCVMLERSARGVIAIGTPEELEGLNDQRVQNFFKRKPGARH